MNRFVLKSTFTKICISLFNKYFYKNKQSKLCFEDRVTVLNIIYFLYGGSKSLATTYAALLRLWNCACVGAVGWGQVMRYLWD